MGNVRRRSLSSSDLTHATDNNLRACNRSAHGNTLPCRSARGSTQTIESFQSSGTVRVMHWMWLCSTIYVTRSSRRNVPSKVPSQTNPLRQHPRAFQDKNRHRRNMLCLGSVQVGSIPARCRPGWRGTSQRRQSAACLPRCIREVQKCCDYVLLLQKKRLERRRQNPSLYG
jgi:hypothetical protein